MYIIDKELSDMYNNIGVVYDVKLNRTDKNLPCIVKAWFNGKSLTFISTNLVLYK